VEVEIKVGFLSYLMSFVLSLDVNFCGYSIPHPLEDRIHFRIQSTGMRAIDKWSAFISVSFVSGTPAIDILKRGLVELEELAAGVQAKFEEACQAAEVSLD